MKRFVERRDLRSKISMLLVLAYDPILEPPEWSLKLGIGLLIEKI